MFIPFLYELRQRKVPVGAQEAVALASALAQGIHEQSLDGFYHVARALLIHSERHLDAFDEAFLSHFKGIETASLKLTEELLDWLKDAKTRRELTDEERELLQKYDPDELFKMLEERLREQKERHDGGNRWIGTGGTSPFGHSGTAREGIRVGGPGGGRSAIAVADARRYRPYRSDLTLDVRQMAVALRKLRAFAREGLDVELDLDGTIDATAKNAGDLDIKLRPPRRPNTRVLLLMDVGGSMDPYAQLVSRLFSAASKATHFKEFRSYYFHNCIYGKLFKTEALDAPLRVADVLAESAPHTKLIFVGDALMAPYELLGTSAYGSDEERAPGIAWLAMLAEHFKKSAWLNPEPERYWAGNTIEVVKTVVPMFELTLDGLGDAVAHLTGAKPKRPS